MNFNNVFVPGEPKNDTELRMDSKIHSEMATERFKKAFVCMLMGAYKTYRVQFDIDGLEPVDPDEIIIAKETWVSEEDQKTQSIYLKKHANSLKTQKTLSSQATL